ncbi:MAG: pyridoxal phosphate-dependent aminotransferase [Bdellovibrio sp.]
MNFNRNIFENPIDVQQIFENVPFEAGYFSPDASSELDRLVRFYELNRLVSLDPVNRNKHEELINKMGIGFGNGTSNVVFNVLRSLMEIKKSKGTKLNVVVALPNYPVYYSQLLSLNIDVRIIKCAEEESFLPTYDQIISLCDENTIGVLLTYPNNPAQHTLQKDFPIECLVEQLKKSDTVLIIDNIYREMNWGEGNNGLEVFLKMNQVNNWILVYGPSKDTPFLSGYRLGYWIGDPRIKEKYRELISASENCLNSYSILLFAVFLLFKGLSHSKNKLKVSDLEMLQDGCCGWSVTLDIQQLFDKVHELNWIEKFQERIFKSNLIQSNALKEITSYLESSKVFCSPINGNIGNLILTGVDRNYFEGSSFDLFEQCLETPKVGILPGSVFGIDLVKNHFIPFRLTTIHDSSENIIGGLSKLETFLLKNR